MRIRQNGQTRTLQGGNSMEVRVFSSAPVTAPFSLARLLRAGVLLAGFIGAALVAQQPATIAIDYPAEGSIFPPDMAAPTFLWRDASEGAAAWSIEVAFSDGSAGITVRTRGERVRIGEIDPRVIAETNELPKLTPQQAAEQSWKPDAETWAAIKKHSAERPATVTISGFGEKDSRQAVSRGRVAIKTSKDPVGAPIFYRDVPLMPSELEKGVIKPLPANAMPLVAWRLRNVGESSSRLLLTGLHTCANCHSFSTDGKTLGMDLDGPENDKGAYFVAPIAPQTTIRSENVFTWNSFEPPGRRTIGFMSSVSPNGQFVVSTVNEDVYVNTFKDYRFLQVFYPTRGILVWYSRATGQIQALPGADDPNYVQSNAVWSPDGKYLVFSRAEAVDAYPQGRELAKFANDPNEVQIQYDLYRIPFNGGKGGRAEPIPGASRNGMSNTFPKISPDGRWIVFVECRNGQLMRPDSQLYILPAEGGQARRMDANTSLMNSWHSFSPNGRWLVFSSKSRSPYTQMFLTHLDEEGRDSPAIPIENSTAANRAVNIPEFVNIPPDGLMKIDAPAAAFYELYDTALQLGEKGQNEAAIAVWKKALEQVSPDDTSALAAKAHSSFGVALAKAGRLDEAIPQFRKAIEIRPANVQAHNNLGVALVQAGKLDEGIVQLREVLLNAPDNAEARNNLGDALLRKGSLDEAIAQFRKVLEVNPASAGVQFNLGRALARKGMLDEAIEHLQKAAGADPGFAPAQYVLGDTFYMRGNIPEALAHWRKGLQLEPDDLPALNQTAWVLATCPQASVRNGAEAVGLAERALQLSGGREPAVLDTLAAAYAEVGRFPEAAETARRAQALATQQNKGPMAERLAARIALYEARAPFHGPR
jgi:tetratricopeptide (TPR) repeat protein